MTVFIKKGDAPLSPMQAVKRGEHILARELSAAGARSGDGELFLSADPDQLPERLVWVLLALPGEPETYADYAAAWEADNLVNGANNMFNHRLAAYRSAVARLERYRKADGREEVLEEVETGEMDDMGNPILEVRVVLPAVDPLPATVEVQVFDPETGVEMGTETVPNPEIVADDEERAAAQATVDASPQEVRDFDV